MKNIDSATSSSGRLRTFSLVLLSIAGLAYLSGCSSSSGASPARRAPVVEMSSTEATASVLEGSASGDGVSAIGTDVDSERECGVSDWDAINELVDGHGVYVVLEGMGQIKANEQECGPDVDWRRQCRALWMMEVLEPMTLALDPELSVQTRSDASAMLDWGLATGAEASSAEPELAAAFTKLRGLSADLALLTDTGENDEVVALAAIARAEPDIIEPLILLSEECAKIP